MINTKEKNKAKRTGCIQMSQDWNLKQDREGLLLQ